MDIVVQRSLLYQTDLSLLHSLLHCREPTVVGNGKHWGKAEKNAGGKPATKKRKKGMISSD